MNNEMGSYQLLKHIPIDEPHSKLNGHGARNGGQDGRGSGQLGGFSTPEHGNRGVIRFKRGRAPQRERHSTGRFDANNAALALSAELKTAVDRIFVEYLSEICSNCEFNLPYHLWSCRRALTNLVSATDARGEAIHQTLPTDMAQDYESPDFKPFTFRSQAFTNGFVQEVRRIFPVLYPPGTYSTLQLARKGYGEHQLPFEKVHTLSSLCDAALSSHAP